MSWNGLQAPSPHEMFGYAQHDNIAVMLSVAEASHELDKPSKTYLKKDGSTSPVLLGTYSSMMTYYLSNSTSLESKLFALIALVLEDTFSLELSCEYSKYSGLSFN